MIPSSTPPPKQLRHSFAVGIYCLLSIPLIFYDLGRYGLVNDDEGFYHYYARHMVETGNWFRFEFAGGQSRFYDAFTHAPLFVWLKAVVITMFGDHYWTMRSVSAVFAVLAVCATYALACRLIDRRAALLAGLLHLTTYQFVFLHGARTGEMEPMIACVMTLIALFFLRAVEDGKSFIPHHFLVVALLWSKTALVLIPIAVELIYFAVHSSQRKHVTSWFKHGVWILPLGSLWLLGQAAFNWQEFQEAIDTASRVAAGGNARSRGVLGNVMYFLPILFWGGFPHSLFYPVGLLSFLGLGQDAKSRRSWHLLGIFLLAILSFYALVSQHFPWYITPLYPLLSIAVASWLVRLSIGVPERWVWVLTLATLALPLWIRIPNLTSHDPFSRRAAQMTGRVEWHGLAGIPAEVCLALGVGLAIVIGLLTWRRLSPGMTRAVSIVIVLGLLAVAGLRATLALRFTDHVSMLEQFVIDLDERRELGETIDYPIDIHCAHAMRFDDNKIRYLLADRYELKLTHRKGPGYWVHFQITGEKNP